MRLSVDVCKNGCVYCLGFLNGKNFNRLKMSDEFVIDLIKYHNHSYCFNAFFYKSEHFYVNYSFSSLKEMYCAIQKILKVELYDVRQN